MDFWCQKLMLKVILDYVRLISHSDASGDVCFLYRFGISK